MKCTIHIDGGARGNPGPAAAGVVIKNADTNKLIYEAGHFLGHMTNNSAEYNGLLKCLEAATELKAKDLLIHSDSELMVKQINGEYRVKSPDLKPLYQRAVKLLSHFPTWKLIHVRREKNVRADELANLAMDAESDIFYSGESGDTESFNQPAADLVPATGGQSNTGSFTVRLTTNDCIHNIKPNRPFKFGHTTPGGCCVHAAQAALATDPLNWPADKTTDDVICKQCWQSINVS
ncbi:ribonuclease HI family protein [Poriferisphaera sp. WC338]|uniref:ribonuclease HI family protein n=1 Tax=Poriferisphaera sp. WC338 TaxID=3425129 RepID=UPI003D814B38